MMKDEDKFIKMRLERAFSPDAVFHDLDFNRLHKKWEARQKELKGQKR